VLQSAAEGVPFWQMAVVVPPDPALAGQVVHSLQQAGVPVLCGVTAATPPGPAARALMGWLELWRDGLRRAPLVEWLRLAPLRPRWAGLDHARWQPALWEQVIRQAHLGSDPAGWPSLLQRWAKEHDPGSWEAQAALDLARVVEHLVAQQQAMAQAAGTWADGCRWLAGWVREALQPCEDGAAVEAGLRALAGLDELEQQLKSTPGPVEAELFVEAVRQQVSAASSRALASRLHFEQGCVAVLTPWQALGCRFAAVALAGVLREHYPGSPPAGLVSLEELEELVGLPSGTLRVRWVAARRRSFSWALLHAAPVVQASFARREHASGREQLPSPWPGELLGAGAFAAVPPGPGAGAPSREDPRWALDLHGARVIQARRLGAPAERWLARCYPAAAQGASARRRRLWGPPGEYDGWVGPEALPAASAQTLELVPTELEQYARCPRLYFFDRVLRVGVSEEPEWGAGLSGADRGLLVHGALRRFYQTLAPGQPLPPDWQQRLARAVQETLQEEFPGLTDGRPAVAFQAEMLAERLALLVASEQASSGSWGQLRELWVEQGFSGLTVAQPDRPEGDQRPGAANLRLRGRMDRVEVWEQDGARRVRVVDYKTGRPQEASADDPLQGGLRLQPAVYLQAACRLARVAPTAARVELVYVDHPGLPRRWVLDGGGWSRLQPLAAQALDTLSRGIREGYFAPDPHPQVRCSSCGFYGVCGGQARRFRERAGERPWEPLARLREGQP
ncbi:MAG TPA: PD-(D/E)XK nuclease family protein, partial [Limnochordales bacterium]